MPFSYPAWRLPPPTPQPIDQVPSGFRTSITAHAREAGLIRPPWGELDEATVLHEYAKQTARPAAAEHDKLVAEALSGLAAIGAPGRGSS